MSDDLERFWFDVENAIFDLNPHDERPYSEVELRNWDWGNGANAAVDYFKDLYELQQAGWE